MRVTPFSSKVLDQPSKVTILMGGMPERRGQKAQSAGAPNSDHDGKTGYDTFVARMGLYPFFNLAILRYRTMFQDKNNPLFSFESRNIYPVCRIIICVICFVLECKCRWKTKMSV
jgi:hypothetical protein